MRHLPLTVVAVVIVALGVATIVPAHAADPFYMGTWQLRFATMAPWGYPSRLQDSADKAKLVQQANPIGWPPLA